MRFSKGVMGAAFILARIGSRYLSGVERVVAGCVTGDAACLGLDTLMGLIGFVALVEDFALVMVAEAILMTVFDTTQRLGCWNF